MTPPTAAAVAVAANSPWQPPPAPLPVRPSPRELAALPRYRDIMPLHRCDSAPALPTTAAPPTPPLPLSAVDRVATMARDGALDILRCGEVDLGAAEAAADMGGAHSSLVRWVENPLRAPALVVYTLAANAGVLNGEAVGGKGAPPAAAVAALRRSGEWHNLVAYPDARPAVGYVCQVLSVATLAAAATGDQCRSRGVEWFLLAQVATGGRLPGVLAGATLPPVPLSLSQVGLTRAPAVPVVSGRASEAGALWVTPTDAVRPWQAVPLAGRPWGIRGVGVWGPLLEVRCPASVLQLLMVDDPAAGASSPVVGMAARRLVPHADFLATAARGVCGGMGVSLLRLHLADVRAVVANKAAASVAPDSPIWLTGVDRAVLHYCRDDLLAWVREGAWAPGARAASFTRLVRHAQSAYLAAVGTTFAAARITDGIEVAGYGAKLRLAVGGTFLRMARRLRRGDPPATLLALLQEEEPRCLAEVFPIVQVDPCVADHQQGSTPPEVGGTGCSATDAGAPAAAAGGQNTLGFGWGPEWPTPSHGSSRDEVLCTEPRNADGGMEPDVDATVSVMDVGLARMLSSRPDKVVWVREQRGGYWRCLLPWLLEVDRTYDLTLAEDASCSLRVRDKTAPSLPTAGVSSYQQLHNAIDSSLRRDLIRVTEATQMMPASWCDPDVRASLLLLLAGARGLIGRPSFSPCLWRLVALLRDVLFHRGRSTTAESVAAAAPSSVPDGASSLRSAELGRGCSSPRTSTVALMATLHLPSEIHCVGVVPPSGTPPRHGWIGIRWH